MENELLKTLGQIAGIGGLSLGVLLLLFRDVIQKQIFSTLTKQQSYKLIVLFLILVWLIAAIGISAWVWVEINSKSTAEITKVKFNQDVSITNADNVNGDKVMGDKVERKIILQGKPVSGKISLSTFTINNKLCDYIEYRLNSSKQFWPKNAEPVWVKYKGGKVELYGKVFDSYEEAEKYGDILRVNYNHYSFTSETSHKIYFERLNEINEKKENPSNFPIFYVAISNQSSEHIIFNNLVAIVYKVEPLVSIGESHTLTPLSNYEISLPPKEGEYTVSLIPNIKIETEDAVALNIVLKPNVQKVGGYLWLMKLKFGYSQGFIESDIFEIIM